MSWCPANIALDCAARIMGSVVNRSAARLVAIVAQFCVEHEVRWQPRDLTGDGKPETFCNVFAYDVAQAMGVPLPRARANDLYDFLMDEATDHATIPPRWELVDAHVAQRCADEGQLVFAAWKNPGGPGHIAVLLPSLGEPGVWIAQAGRVNFGRGRLENGFGTLSPSFFVHP